MTSTQKPDSSRKASKQKLTSSGGVLDQTLPAWVGMGTVMLAAIAGYINVVGLLGFEQQAITHMTGTSSQLSAAFAAKDGALITRFFLMLLMFVGGAALSGLIVGKTSLKLGRRYGVALLIESFLLMVATFLLHHERFSGVYFAAAACGVQNAMVTTFSGAAIRTTHVSGMFTDIGIYLGHWIGGGSLNRVRLTISMWVIAGFIGGGWIGALMFPSWGNLALMWPALLTGLVALAYYQYVSYARQRLPKSDECPFEVTVAFQQFEKLAQMRRDTRRFRTDPIAPKLLQRLISIAELAPSVGLSQPWRVWQVHTPEMRAAMRANFEHSNAMAASAYEGFEREAYLRLKLAGFVEAPIHLAVFCEANSTQGRGLGRQTQPKTLEYSCVCMVHTLMLAAHAAGLGVGWVSILDEQQTRADLQYPEHWQLVAYLLLGYPEQAASEIPELMRLGWQTRTDFGKRWTVR